MSYMSSLFSELAERRVIRRSVALPCQVVREQDFRLVSHQSLDLSSDGMLVGMDDEVRDGEQLIVSFRATVLDLWFDTTARVVRIVHGRRTWDRRPAFGLEFGSLNPLARFALQGAYRNVPPPIPARAPRFRLGRRGPVPSEA